MQNPLIVMSAITGKPDYEQISNYMSSMKLSVFEEKFKVCFIPTKKDLENATLFGEKFAKSLNLTQK